MVRFLLSFSHISHDIQAVMGRMVRQSHEEQVGWSTGMEEEALIADPLALEIQNRYSGN